MNKEVLKIMINLKNYILRGERIARCYANLKEQQQKNFFKKKLP